jgi:fatty-acyl-CoA synthase
MVRGCWRIVAQHGATLVGGVPTSVGAVLDVPLEGADLSRVRAGFCGAASLPPAVASRFRQVVGRGLYEVYGMTEASGLIAIDPVAGDGNVGSVGLALPYTEVEVRRLDADGRLGPACATDEIGVIVVKGPHLSRGYRNPEHDAGVFDRGALNSGDLGYLDARGCLRIAGRSKDLIIRGGHNIDPLMIENAMAAHPAVAMAAAVGMPDGYAGELPVCYVALRAGATASEAQLREHAQRTIAERPAWPKRIFIVDAIPVTTVGKIYKPRLRCDAAERLVAELVRERFALTDARIEAREGGRRGLHVRVALPESGRQIVPSLEEALAAFPFGSEVACG